MSKSGIAFSINHKDVMKHHDIKMTDVSPVTNELT